MKAPLCCGKWMELKASYYAGGSFYVFQCKKCGNIEEEEIDD